MANAYDVFISYSHENYDWVHTILEAKLRDHAFRVLTDDDFRGGGLSVQEMAEGVENSRHVVAVLSPAFVESKWATFETAMAQTLDPAASERKLIPILLESCDIPLRLRVLHYRDLRNDSPEEWDRLIRDLI